MKKNSIDKGLFRIPNFLRWEFEGYFNELLRRTLVNSVFSFLLKKIPREEGRNDERI